MTIEEAKFILSAYRPNGSDSGDPAMRDALGMAKEDPALRAWFEQSQAHDRIVAAKLSEIFPPKGLKEAILAGVKASGYQGRSGRRWSWIGGLAAAAALVVGVVSIRTHFEETTATTALAQFAINDMVAGNHGGRGEPTSKLISRLQTPGLKMPGSDAIDFDKLKDTGCRSLTFAGHNVMEVCFARDGVEFHFYVARKEGSLASLAAQGPSFLTEASGAAAVWSDARFDYALATTAGVQALRKLL